MLIASNGHFLTQIPQPIHNSSEMTATGSVGPTSIHMAPLRTTGHIFLHSCRHFFGLHLSVWTMAIRVSLSAIFGFSGEDGRGCQIPLFTPHRLQALRRMEGFPDPQHLWLVGRWLDGLISFLCHMHAHEIPIDEETEWNVDVLQVQSDAGGLRKHWRSTELQFVTDLLEDDNRWQWMSNAARDDLISQIVFFESDALDTMQVMETLLKEISGHCQEMEIPVADREESPIPMMIPSKNGNGVVKKVEKGKQSASVHVHAASPAEDHAMIDSSPRLQELEEQLTTIENETKNLLKQAAMIKSQSMSDSNLTASKRKEEEDALQEQGDSSMGNVSNVVQDDLHKDDLGEAQVEVEAKAGGIPNPDREEDSLYPLWSSSDEEVSHPEGEEVGESSLVDWLNSPRDHDSQDPAAMAADDRDGHTRYYDMPQSLSSYPSSSSPASSPASSLSLSRCPKWSQPLYQLWEQVCGAPQPLGEIPLDWWQQLLVPLPHAHGVKLKVQGEDHALQLNDTCPLPQLSTATPLGTQLFLHRLLQRIAQVWGLSPRMENYVTALSAQLCAVFSLEDTGEFASLPAQWIQASLPRMSAVPVECWRIFCEDVTILDVTHPNWEGKRAERVGTAALLLPSCTSCKMSRYRKDWCEEICMSLPPHALRTLIVEEEQSIVPEEDWRQFQVVQQYLQPTQESS